MGKNYWMVVESLNNHTITRERGLEVIGFGQPFRRRVQRMQRGDMVLFYVSTTRKWTATATISSEHFEDYAPIWEPTSRGEQYPFRVNLLPDIRLNEGQYIDAMLLAPRLDYLRRWTPEDWPLAFMERLHLIPQKDFRLIEGEMYRVTGRRQPPLKQPKRRQKRGTDSGFRGGAGTAQPSSNPERQGDRPATAQNNGGPEAQSGDSEERRERSAGRPRFRQKSGQARSRHREARGPA